MFKTVVVGVRDVAHTLDAVSLARVLAPGCELHLVHAHPREQAAWTDAKPWRAMLDRGADRLLHDVARDTGVEAGLRSIADVSPARALQATARELDADLIVVGSSHHGAIGRLLAGSVARGTLSGAPCPVAVTPRGYAATALAEVAVGFDDTPEAWIALRVAAEVARAAGARLRVVQAVAPPLEVVAPMYPMTYTAHEWDAYGEREIALAREAVERAAAEFASELVITGEVALGRARKELAALSTDVDLLVVGSRGWGPARHVLLGGTSHHLVHHAACPVLVVPRGAEEAPAAGAEASPGSSWRVSGG
jgi:nucleotide-binding universal stress UspA family protein